MWTKIVPPIFIGILGVVMIVIGGYGAIQSNKRQQEREQFETACLATCAPYQTLIHGNQCLCLQPDATYKEVQIDGR